MGSGVERILTWHGHQSRGGTPVVEVGGRATHSLDLRFRGRDCKPIAVILFLEVTAMMLTNWRQWLSRRGAPRRRGAMRNRLRLERLEDRTVPSTLDVTGGN